MLIERIKDIAEQLEYGFKYGADHWQNLGDWPDDAALPFEDRKKYLQLLWVDDADKINGHGATEGYTHDGQFVLSVRSKIGDASYEFKYETHIKSLKAELEKIKSEIGNCDGFLLKAWKATEVENLYDANMDGLKVTFKIETE